MLYQKQKQTYDLIEFSTVQRKSLELQPIFTIFTF